jgi:hypothetical protein
MSSFSEFNVQPPPRLINVNSINNLRNDVQNLKDQLLFLQSLLIMNPNLIPVSKVPELIKIQEKIKQIDNKLQRWS